MSDFDLPITALTPRRHRYAVRELVNRERRQRGLPDLRGSGLLRRSAHSWARHISRRSDFSNGNLDARARRWPFVRSAIGQGRQWRVGEALAWGARADSTPRAIVAAWMASPQHRDLLLSSWTHDAVWTVNDGPQPGRQRDAAIVALHLGWRGPRA